MDQAIRWFDRLQSDGTDGPSWAAFTEWLEADPAHRMAFDQVEDLHLAVDGAASDLAPLVQERLAPRPILFGQAARWGAAAALGLLAASLVLVWTVGRSPSTMASLDYATGVGETKSVALADGTVLTLAPQSHLGVHFAGTERRIEFITGEALFNVRHDPAHPFIVAAGDREIRDIGTIFDVRREGDAMAVQVAEGKVAVWSSGMMVELDQGKSIAYPGSGAPGVINPADPATIGAWSGGYLTYENAPLAQVVADLNRYFPHPIHLVETTSGRQLFSGVLKIDDEDKVLHRLTQILPLTVDHGSDGSITLRSGN
jgi:transmembrane sensor